MTEPRNGLAAPRLSISLTFVLHASVSGTWGPRVPALKAQAGLGDGELGLALFGMAAGLLAGTRLAGAPVERFGGRRVLRVGVPLLGAALLLPALAHALLPLAAGFLVLGFVSGFLDVAMNAQGVDVERELGRPILNGLHGLWSVGLGLGAAGAAVAATAGADPAVHFAIVGALIAVGSVPALGGLLRTSRTGGETADGGATETSLWAPVVLLLGGIAFASFIGEGSVNDWSAVYLREGLGTSAGLAAAGFGAFSVAMAASRFAGDRLAMRVGPVRLVRAGSLTAAAGLSLGLAINEPAAIIAGFALFGAGLAPVVPTAFQRRWTPRRAGRRARPRPRGHVRLRRLGARPAAHRRHRRADEPASRPLPAGRARRRGRCRRAERRPCRRLRLPRRGFAAAEVPPVRRRTRESRSGG